MSLFMFDFSGKIPCCLIFILLFCFNDLIVSYNMLGSPINNLFGLLFGKRLWTETSVVVIFMSTVK